MAGANQLFTSVSMESELRKLKEEEGEVKEVHQEEEEDMVRNVEEDEEDDYEDEEDKKIRKGEDTCVYDEYELIEDVSEDIFAKDDPEEYRIYLRFVLKGFYVPFAPKDAIGVATPIGPSSPWWSKAEEGAELAAAHYNKNRAGPDGQLKLVIIQLANIRSVCGMLFYYLTLGCENVVGGDISDYQTKLWRGYKGNWQVLLFRKDPEIASELIQHYKETLQRMFPNERIY